MSLMTAEIRRIVAEDVSSRLDQINVIFEALTNSIHADATTISCTLESDTFGDIMTDAGPANRVDKIVIKDNGAGFNDDNYRSFCKYRSDFKKNLGGKGVGRMVYLKVFEKVEIVSEIEGENIKVSFDFDLDFDVERRTIEDAEVSDSSTYISFSGLTFASRT